MTKSQRDSIQSPTAGLVIYCTDCLAGKLQVFNGWKWKTPEDGTLWKLVGMEIEGESSGDRSGFSVAISGDGAFVAASGAVSYVNNGLTPLLWGLPVVLSNNIPQGTIVCKSFEASMYFDRESVVIEMFEQDEDNVSNNLVTVRGENRGAQAIFRPEAITTGAVAGPYV
jgi:hypothetical protein